MRARRAYTAKPPTVKETPFQQSVIELAQWNGWTVAHFRTVRVQRADGSVHYETPVQADGKGYPDLHLVRGSRSIFAELKTDDRRSQPTEEQTAWLHRLAESGHETYIWRPRDWDDLARLLAR